MLSILTGGSNIRISDGGALKRKREPSATTSESTAQSCQGLREQNKIVVSGEKQSEQCRPIASFEETFEGPLLDNIHHYGYTKPTPIQMQAIPLLLQKTDLLACAPTGSGKTLAFALPIISRLKKHNASGYRAVVVSPTRELATQIYNQFRKMTEKNSLRVNLLTKSNAVIQSQKATELATSYDILITTPQRLVNAVKEENIQLDQVKILILDEADRLFEDGFVEQTDEILAACSNKSLRKALFSATLPSGVEQLAKSVMKHPVRIIVGHKDTITDLIEQSLQFVGTESGKLVAMRQLAKTGMLKPPVLIFVQSIERAKELYEELSEDSLNVDVIHSDRPQGQRDDVIAKFRRGQIWILIATELLSRGIDFQHVSLVVNYDFPQSLQSYIHRIGRTGRAGHSGKAITFFSKDDARYLKSVASVIQASGGEVPAWMLDLKAPSKKEKKELKRMPIARKPISTKSKHDREKEAHKKDMIRASIIKKNQQKKATALQQNSTSDVEE